MKKILIIGGTGIIGKATIAEALQNGYEVHTIGIKEEKSIPPEVHQIIADKQEPRQYDAVVGELNRHNEWDVVFDVYNLGKSSAQQTHNNFRDNAKHIVVVSTTLVYDRSKPNTEPIKSTHPLAELGTMGGYADHKIELEHYWQSVKDVPWTILRPYHIVGAYSLLGCMPDENRDPRLLEKIKNGETLQLCEGGEIPFNYVHPQDIARIALRAAGKPETFGKAYNAVNPTVITAKEYFELIGKALGQEVIINNKPIRQVWEESRGWELTTLPHIYDTSDMERDISFVPSTPIDVAIREAVEHYPTGEQEIKEIAIHKRMTMEPRPRKIQWLIENDPIRESEKNIRR
ncbi:MAG: NAD-dependent epimerase/dehydratase family protein [Patescibacteria group bacterium]|jgi:nucleoside-diphosphate-sugar epimerase